MSAVREEREVDTGAQLGIAGIPAHRMVLLTCMVVLSSSVNPT